MSSRLQALALHFQEEGIMENTNQITKKFNPAHAQAIMELLAKSPFYDLIDMDMVATEPGYAQRRS